MSQLIIRPSGPLRGAITAPGDKSISHRALLLGALAQGDILVRGWLPAEDCQATLRCVQALGVTAAPTPALPRPAGEGGAGGQAPSAGSGQAQGDHPDEPALIVHGIGMNGLREPADVLDCGGSGTTMRLLAGILAGQPFISMLTGNEALRRRPMGRIAEPLRKMGAVVLGRGDGRLPPLAIRGGGLHGIEYRMPVASAQVKSALLLAGLFAEGETIIYEPGPARDHTERMLRAFGVVLEIEGSTIRLAGGQTLAAPLDAGGCAVVRVPADFSSAAFPMVAAAIVPGSEVCLRQVGVNPTRTGLLDLLEGMGADVRRQESEARRSEGSIQGASAPRSTSARTPRKSLSQRVPGAQVSFSVGEPVADLLVRAAALRAVDAGGDLVVRAIDEFPIFAVAATQAEGTTAIRDASELRVKESDRISSVATELAKLAARVEERPDGLVIHGPTRLVGAVVDSHRDHRLAMALAVAGLVARGETVVQNAEAIHDSFPGFVETMRALGADVAWE